MPPNLRIRGHLSSSIINGGGAVGSGRICYFQGLVTLTLTLDRVTSRCIPSCITRRPLPTYQIVIEMEETFCGQTDGRTRGRAGGHFRPTLLGRLGGVDLKQIGLEPDIAIFPYGLEGGHH